MNVPHALRSPALSARFFAVDTTHLRNVRRGPSVRSNAVAAPKSLSGQTGGGYLTRFASDARKASRVSSVALSARGDSGGTTCDMSANPVRM